MRRLEHRRTHRHFGAQAFLLMQAITRAASGVERQPFAPERGILLTGEIDGAVVDHHDLGEQFCGRTENPRHTHAHERVVAHEPGELQVLRMGADQLQHLPEYAQVAHATTVQAHVQFNIHAQPRPQTLGQRQVLLEPFRGIEQPL